MSRSSSRPEPVPVTVTLRVPVEMLRKVDRAAKADHRTRTSMVLHLIETHPKFNGKE